MPLMDNGVKKWQAACVVFLISAFFHEVSSNVFGVKIRKDGNCLSMPLFCYAVRCKHPIRNISSMGIYWHVDTIAICHVCISLHERSSWQYGRVDVVNCWTTIGHSHVFSRLLRHGKEGWTGICSFVLILCSVMFRSCTVPLSNHQNRLFRTFI